MTRAQRYSDVVAHHGEGPLWDEREQRLLLVDLLAGDVVALAAGARPARHHVGSVAAALRPRAGGGFVLAVERGFALADDRLVVTEVLPPAFTDPAIRMNDGGCDPLGRFWCGTMAYSTAPGAGTLYRLDADRSVRAVLEGVTISNGIQWSADGALAYYNDTPTGRVDVFDVDAAGDLHDRRPFAAIPEGAGLPDGMAIDAEGGVWVALWEGGAVHRYDADGALTEVVELPVSRVTACTFGGPDRRTLLITTSRDGLPEGAEPAAGSVFALDTGVAGGVVHAYAG